MQIMTPNEHDLYTIFVATFELYETFETFYENSDNIDEDILLRVLLLWPSTSLDQYLPNSITKKNYGKVTHSKIIFVLINS